MNKQSVYLDYNSTTIPCDLALKAAEKAIKLWANPSSVYQIGVEVKNALWEAREDLANFIGAHPLEIILTSGASEANNHAIKGIFDKEVQNPLVKVLQSLNSKSKKNELIVSSVEHPSVMAVAEYLSERGIKVHKIPVSKNGELDQKFYEKCLSEKTLLVSVMLANNETGILFPIKEMAEKAHKAGALFHSDMVQALSKIPIDVKDLGVDLASFSGHKCHALKGSGFLYCKKGTELNSLIHGGPQERKRRAGTENLTSIMAFGAVAKEKDFFLNQNQKVEQLRNEMEKQILSHISGVHIVGQNVLRVPNTSFLLIDGVEGESLLMNLDLKGFCVSVGSACSSGVQKNSTVLIAMGYSANQARNSLRISLSYRVEQKDIDLFIQALKESVNTIRNI